LLLVFYGNNKRRKMNKQLKALLASYTRSVVGAGVTLYLAGVTDPADLAYSLLGALIPVAARYLNPKDAAFGRTPKAEEVAEALEAVKPVKAPAKKPVAPKSPSKAATAKKPAVKK
jgi:hypothetical protein